MIVYFRPMRIKDDIKQEALFQATVKLVNEIGFVSSSVAKIAKEAEKRAKEAAIAASEAATKAAEAEAAAKAAEAEAKAAEEAEKSEATSNVTSGANLNGLEAEIPGGECRARHQSAATDRAEDDV